MHGVNYGVPTSAILSLHHCLEPELSERCLECKDPPHPLKYRDYSVVSVNIELEEYDVAVGKTSWYTPYWSVYSSAVRTTTVVNVLVHYRAPDTYLELSMLLEQKGEACTRMYEELIERREYCFSVTL